jgi:hypothetical protein
MSKQHGLRAFTEYPHVVPNKNVLSQSVSPSKLCSIPF